MLGFLLLPFSLSFALKWKLFHLWIAIDVKWAKTKGGSCYGLWLSPYLSMKSWNLEEYKYTYTMYTLLLVKYSTSVPFRINKLFAVSGRIFFSFYFLNSVCHFKPFQSKLSFGYVVTLRQTTENYDSRKLLTLQKYQTLLLVLFSFFPFSHFDSVYVM